MLKEIHEYTFDRWKGLGNIEDGDIIEDYLDKVEEYLLTRTTSNFIVSITSPNKLTFKTNSSINESILYTLESACIYANILTAEYIKNNIN